MSVRTRFSSHDSHQFSQYFERTDEDNGDEMDEVSSESRSGKKRKGKRSRNENLQVAKRVKGKFHLPLSLQVTWHIWWLLDGHVRSSSRVLTSLFAQDNTGPGLVEEPIVESADPIHFKRTVCTISPNSGHYSFTESSTVETGLLDQKTMFLSISDRGKTKDVYGVRWITTYLKLLSPKRWIRWSSRATSLLPRNW